MKKFSLMNNDEIRFGSDDKELTQSKEYEKVMLVIKDLWNCGVVQRGEGYCYAMSDMMYNLLALQGIESKLVECTLTVINNNPPSLHLVGHSGQAHEDVNEMNSHVVCVTTNTDIPILIDLSIGHLIPGIPFICERLNDDSAGKLANYTILNSVWNYSQKESYSLRLPRIHQQSILERIHLDKKIESNFKTINKIMVIIAFITSINFIRGGADYYQKYINKTNGFGPVQKTLVK